MKTVTGVFLSSGDAERAAGALRGRGFGYENMNLLMPGQQGSRAGHMDALPATAGEQPGMGRAVGSVVGGAVGAAGGMHLGMIAASLFVPGVGPIVALGLGAAEGVSIADLPVPKEPRRASNRLSPPRWLGDGLERMAVRRRWSSATSIASAPMRLPKSSPARWRGTWPSSRGRPTSSSSA